MVSETELSPSPPELQPMRARVKIANMANKILNFFMEYPPFFIKNLLIIRTVSIRLFKIPFTTPRKVEARLVMLMSLTNEQKSLLVIILIL